MADTLTREILETLRKYTKCSEFERWDSADKKAADYYRRGYIMALDEIEQYLNSRRDAWKMGLDFEGMYSSAGDFMGEHKLEPIGDVLFGKGWYDGPDQNDDESIQEICDFLYPHRYLVTCLELGEQDIQVIEIGV